MYLKGKSQDIFVALFLLKHGHGMEGIESLGIHIALAAQEMVRAVKSRARRQVHFAGGTACFFSRPETAFSRKCGEVTRQGWWRSDLAESLTRVVAGSFVGHGLRR
jgi:hypothetical protein